MVRLPLSKTDLVQTTLLTIGLCSAWVASLPWICKFWLFLFDYWTRALEMEGTVTALPQSWFKFANLSLPFVSVEAGSVSPPVWAITLLVTAVVLAATFLGEGHSPWVYLVRALVFIQASALVYFAVASARFPHDIPTYTTGMLSFGVLLIGMIPIVLAFTYYVFDFSLWKKLGVSVLLMVHLTLFFPLQYVLHVYILHYSILYMPLLYFAFGPFLDVLIFVCFYSWAMSWQSRSTPQSDYPTKVLT
jgi:hypothetical protein